MSSYRLDSQSNGKNHFLGGSVDKRFMTPQLSPSKLQIFTILSEAQLTIPLGSLIFFIDVIGYVCAFHSLTK